VKRLFLLLATPLLAAPVCAQSPGVHDAMGSITEQDILTRIGVIAHDSMRGRDTPSPELDEVARYIAAEFRRFGLTPGGDDGGFIQRYPLRTVRLDVASSTVSVPDGPTWRLGGEVIRHFGGMAPDGITGPAVLITGSEEAPDGLGGSLEGAIALVMFEFGPSSNAVFNSVQAASPAAVILVTQRPDERWNQLVGRQGAERSSTAWAEASGAPVIEIREPTLASTLAAHGVDVAAARARRGAPITAQPIGGLELTVTLQETVVQDLSAPNVVGILRGSDPALRDEYVVYSAHMDHVGVGQPVQGDSIFNGADDDASGTVGVIELAEAFALLQPRPKRSMIFLTVSGEEKGLWGSEYFAANPPVPVEGIVANLNADMIGRNWKDTIVVIGKEHSDLGATLERVNAAHPELNMTAIDDLWPDENFYRRSDHFNFARKGVPILFFFNGTHDDYHRPSDEVAKIDGEKEARIVKLMFYLGLEVANTAERPKWNPESYAEIVEGEQ
jgi:hypothetical protein